MDVACHRWGRPQWNAGIGRGLDQRHPVEYAGDFDLQTGPLAY